MSSLIYEFSSLSNLSRNLSRLVNNTSFSSSFRSIISLSYSLFIALISINFFLNSFFLLFTFVENSLFCFDVVLIVVSLFFSIDRLRLKFLSNYLTFLDLSGSKLIHKLLSVSQLFSESLSIS